MGDPWQIYRDVTSGDLTGQLRRLIRGGRLQTGTRLPSERDFAKRFDLPRAVVRTSLAELEREGWIDCAHGSGRSVADMSQRLGRGVIGVITAAELSRVYGSGGSVGSAHPAHSDYQAACAVGELQNRKQAALVVHPQRLQDNGIDWLVAGEVLGLVIAQVEVDRHDLSQEMVAARSAGLEIACYGSSGRVIAEGEDPPEESFDRVISNHEAGAASLTRWLLDQGRRNILRLWRFPELRDWRLARDVGHEDEMRRQGLEPRPPVVTGHIVAGERSAVQDEQAYDTVIATLMGVLYPHVHGNAGPIDAIMVATDRHALEVSDAVMRLGLTPGRDVLIVGYDNDYISLLPSYPRAAAPAATVDKNNDRIGRELVHLLMDRLAGKLPPEPQIRELTPSLVIPDGGESSTNIPLSLGHERREPAKL